jgi:hypothetical protein
MAKSARHVRTLPGAVFFGNAIKAEDLEYAKELQRIRTEYENCQEMLWHDLSQMGFDSSEIQRCVADPAVITSCAYILVERGEAVAAARDHNCYSRKRAWCENSSGRAQTGP